MTTNDTPKPDPGNKLLEDLRQKGAEVIEFSPDAAYMVAFNAKSMRAIDAKHMVEVLNERGITADAVLVMGDPKDVMAVYKYQPDKLPSGESVINEDDEKHAD